MKTRSKYFEYKIEYIKQKSPTITWENVEENALLSLPITYSAVKSFLELFKENEHRAIEYSPIKKEGTLTNLFNVKVNLSTLTVPINSMIKRIVDFLNLMHDPAQNQGWSFVEDELSYAGPSRFFEDPNKKPFNFNHFKSRAIHAGFTEDFIQEFLLNIYIEDHSKVTLYIVDKKIFPQLLNLVNDFSGELIDSPTLSRISAPASPRNKNNSLVHRFICNLKSSVKDKARDIKESCQKIDFKA